MIEITTTYKIERTFFCSVCGGRRNFYLTFDDGGITFNPDFEYIYFKCSGCKRIEPVILPNDLH